MREFNTKRECEQYLNSIIGGIILLIAFLVSLLVLAVIHPILALIWFVYILWSLHRQAKK